MIYLIDDKKDRQTSLGWSADKLSKHKDVLIPIDNYKQIESEEQREKLFSEESVILYHDSFFDNPNNYCKRSLSIKELLTEHADKVKKSVVFFSGSIGSRVIDESIVSVPVSILYQNLDIFIDDYRKNKNNYDINKVAYGHDYEREKLLEIKKEIWNLLFEKNDNDLFINKGLINLKLEKIEKKLILDNITIGCLKSQINK